MKSNKIYGLFGAIFRFRFIHLIYAIVCILIGNFFVLTHWALDHIKSGTITLDQIFEKNPELCTKWKRKIYCKTWALICHS